MFPIRDTLPAQGKSVTNWAIILACGWIFWYQPEVDDPELTAWMLEWGVIPAEYAAEATGRWLPWLTAMFVHGGWLHLIANMWSLWIFGDNVEAAMGRVRYLVFYLLAGLGGTLAHVLMNGDSTVPVVGASGAISGVMAAYLFLFPASRIVMLFPLLFIPFFFQIPAWTYILFWIFFETLMGLQQHAGVGIETGVAVWAHVGGFAAGAALFRLFIKRDFRAKAEA